MIKLFHKLMTAALPVLLWGTLLTGCIRMINIIR